MNNNLIELLNNFWLSKKQWEIFLYLYKYWTKTASIVANAVWWERTNIYKSLQKMTKDWIISQISKRGVKHFYIHDKKVLSNKLKEEEKELLNKTNNLSILESELERLDKENFSTRPSIRFFEWEDWVDLFYKDLQGEIKKSNLLMIKMFASNTLENQTSNTFSRYSWKFLDNLKSNNINIEMYLWNGIMLLENMIKTYDTSILENLPAWNSSIQTFIFWDFVYIIIFKEIPFWIKIESPEFAQMMHFLLKSIDKK